MQDFHHSKTPPDNYLVWAILATVLCCLPFGIVSIVYASQVNDKFYAGDYAGAAQAAKDAKRWAWVSFIAGLVIGFLVIAFYGAVIIALISSTPH